MMCVFTTAEFNNDKIRAHNAIESCKKEQKNYDTK